MHIKIVPKAIFIQRNNQVLILNDLMLYTWCMNEDWKKNWFSFSVDIMQSLLPNSLHNSVMEIFPGEDLRRRNLSFELFRWGLFRLPEIRWDWITIHCRIHGLLSTLGFYSSCSHLAVKSNGSELCRLSSELLIKYIPSN